jgi:hypothetical protein
MMVATSKRPEVCVRAPSMASRRPEVVCCAESKAMVASGSGAFSSMVVSGSARSAAWSLKTISVSPIWMRSPCASPTVCSRREPL